MNDFRKLLWLGVLSVVLSTGITHGQDVTVDATSDPLAVTAASNLADLSPTDGVGVLIKTGSEAGLWRYSRASSASVDGTTVLNGPGGVGRFLVITAAGGGGDAVLNTDTSTADMDFVIDEDSFATNSATLIPTQQSVKAYVDAEVAGVSGIPSGGSQYHLLQKNSGTDGDASWVSSIGRLTVASGTLTDSTPIGITQTWNDGTEAMTALDINVTDTASAVGSLLANFRLNNTSVASINKSGIGLFGLGTAGGPGISFVGDTDTGLYGNGTNSLLVSTGGSDRVRVNSSGLLTVHGIWFGPISSPQVNLLSDAAAQLAVRNGTTAQSLAIYTTESSSLSNYERIRIYGTAAGAFTVGSEAAGTGVVRDVAIATGGTARLTINGSSGNATFSGSATLGASGGLSWTSRNIITSPSAGVLLFQNNTQTDFDRLQLGGTTDSFPAIKRDTTNVNFVLAATSSTRTGIGVSKINQETTTATNPTTTQYSTDNDFGVHRNSASGGLSLAVNDAGTIKHIANHGTATATDGDTTPSVAGLKVLVLAQTAPTTITDFDDGVNEQIIHIHADDNTDISDGGDLVLDTGVAFTTGAGGGILTLINRSGTWYEVSRTNF